VIVVSRNSINQYGSVVVVIPITGREHKRTTYPSQIVLRAGEGGLRKDSVALCEQIRAISKTRLVRQLGALSVARIKELSAALKITLDLE
jgi:mRNA interferase MazF